MPVLAHIVEQHAEDAAFLWLLRDRAAEAPDEDLDSLAGLDDRLAAHLDGLRIAGDDGWRLCRERLEGAGADAGEVFVAATIALQAASGPDDRLDAVLTAATEPAAARAVAAAAGWTPFDRGVADRLLASEEPARRRLGIAFVALHRQEVGGAVERALGDPEAAVRRRGLDAAGELGRVDLLPAVRAALADEAPECRLAAAVAAAMLGLRRAAVPVLVEAAEAGGGDREAGAVTALAARCSPTETAGWETAGWLRRLAEEPATARAALTGMAALGDPAQVPWLIERLDDPALARGAGEAISWIAGVDLEAEALTVPPPASSEPSDDPADETVDLEADAALPWPDAGRVAAWWHDAGGSIPRGARHLAGRPIAPASLTGVLRHGGQRLRRAAAVELAMCDPGGELFPTRAPARRQRAALAALD